MFPQNTTQEKDNGCSGAKAFFTLNWAGSDNTYTHKYKGFNLTATFRGYRWLVKKQNDWKAMKLDWQGRIDNELEEYDAINWNDYKQKYREKIKTEGETKKKEREEREKKANQLRADGKDGEGNDNYQGLLQQIEELKKNSTKPLKLKEKDMQEIMAKVEKKNQEALDRINKEIELKNEEITKLAQEAQRAREAGDKASQNKINALIRKHQEELTVLNNQKKETPTTDNLKEYLKVSGDNSPIFDPKSKRFWLFSSLALGILIIIVLIILWIIRKVSAIFSNT